MRLAGGGPLADCQCPYTQIWNIPRDWPAWRPFFSWATRYAWEQQSFARALEFHLKRNPAGVVHVADPVLAYRLSLKSRALGYELIYKDGLLLGPAWWKQFRWVQVLAPHYRDDAVAQGINVDHCFVIPHMVDPDRFHPVADKLSARRKVLGHPIPPEAMVIVAAGDFSVGSKKRLDWIVSEVQKLDRGFPVHLVLAGQASPADVSSMRALCAPLGDRVHLRPNTPPADMVALYQSADIMAHAALREPFGIALIEGMACGVPVIGHAGHAVTGWIIGEGGATVDMTLSGALASLVNNWLANPNLVADLGHAARERALAYFSPAAVVPLYKQLYGQVCPD